MFIERIHRLVTQVPADVKIEKTDRGVSTFVYKEDRFYKVENGHYINEAHLQDYGGGLKHVEGNDFYEGIA